MVRPDAREVATGRWLGILVALGVDAAHLTGKHVACPVCGGTDRFRFDDKAGRGTFFCSHCGAGDGFTLLGRLKGWDFKTRRERLSRLPALQPPSCQRRLLATRTNSRH